MNLDTKAYQNYLEVRSKKYKKNITEQDADTQT